MRRFLVPVLVGFVLVGRAALAFDISTCGDVTIPAGETGVLQSDTSCGGAFVGFHVLGGSTLDLNGHTISDAGAGGTAIRCEALRCTVRGPGAIAGASRGFNAITLLSRTRLTINDVTIHDVDYGIVGGLRTSVTATNLTLTENFQGIFGVTSLKATNLVANDNLLKGVEVERRFVGTNVTTNGNGTHGIYFGRLRLTGLTAVGNGRSGVRVLGARLRDSTVTGNSAGGNGIDLETIRRPILTNVACGKSGVFDDWAQAEALGTWGVCAND